MRPTSVEQRLLLLFHYLVLSSNAESSLGPMIWVIEGERASLPCPFAPSIRGDRPVLVLWFKDAGTESIYSYDARDEDLSSGVRWSDEDVLGGRAFFGVTSRPPALALEPARRGDQGQFTCRVEYLKSQSTFRRANLSVIIPPEPPTLLWKGRAVLGPVGPVPFGSAVWLECETSGGRPTPIVTWWQSGRQLESVTEANVVGGEAVVRSKLRLDATRDLSLVPIVCHAQAPNPGNILSQPRTVSTILNVTLPPLNVKISGLDGPISEGTTVQPVCLSAGSNPLAQLRWFNNGKEIGHASKSILDGGNITRSSVTLHVSRGDHGALVQCLASNPQLTPNLKQTHTLSDTVQLNVFYKPRLLVELGKVLNASGLVEGRDAFVECLVDANPAPHRIEWFHNEEVVSSQSGLIVSGPHLALQRLRKAHAGTYKCAADNSEGRTISSPLQINIKYAPVCATTRDRTQGAALGQSIRVLCTVESDPAANVTFAWSKVLPSGREMPLPAEHVTSHALSARLALTPTHLPDFGHFLCRASNAIGTQRVPCRITVVSAGPPEPPLNCSTSPGAQSLTVTCSEGFHGGFPQKFQMEAWRRTKLISNVTTEFPTWTIRDLEDGTELRVKIRSKNAKGFSKYISFDAHMPIAHQQSVTTPELTESELGPILGAIIGGLSVFLIILFVALITMCRRKRLSSRREKGDRERQSLGEVQGGDVSPDVVSSVQLRATTPGVDVLGHSGMIEGAADDMRQQKNNQRFAYQRYHRPDDLPLAEEDEGSFKTVYIASPTLQSPKSNNFYVKLYNTQPQSPYLEPRIITGDEHMFDQKLLPIRDHDPDIKRHQKHKELMQNLLKDGENYDDEDEEDTEEEEREIEREIEELEDLERIATTFGEKKSFTKVLVKAGSVLNISSMERPKIESERPNCVFISSSQRGSPPIEGLPTGSKRRKPSLSSSKEKLYNEVTNIKAVTKSSSDYRESTV